MYPLILNPLTVDAGVGVAGSGWAHVLTLNNLFTAIVNFSHSVLQEAPLRADVFSNCLCALMCFAGCPDNSR